MSSSMLYIDSVALCRFASDTLVSLGMDVEDAQLVADSLVEADLRGTDTHGVARLPHYVRRIRQGSVEVRPHIDVTQVAPALARLDGGHCLGQIANARAADLAIELARTAGAGWVSIANSSHCGAMSYFGMKIARAGMVGFAFTHVDPMVVPFGASEPFCGTNPICITAPGRDGQTLCLDMATSVTPWNAVANAEIEGQPIPKDWGVDVQGKSTTDPSSVVGLRPTGGYKGSGLGMMIDVLCAMLSNSPYGPDIPRMYGDLSERRRLGGLIGAIDIERFVSIDVFQQRVSEMISRWGALRSEESGQGVLYPGEKEERIKKERLVSGIPIGQGVRQSLDEMAKEAGTSPLVFADSQSDPSVPDIVIRAEEFAKKKQERIGH